MQFDVRDFTIRISAMIITIADLLTKIIEKEKEVLARQPDLNHMPMLGDMYEGLARNIIDKAIFDGLNLKVAEGKIRFKNGKYSDQIDCIVAEGDGERIPHTSHFIYDIDKVVAIFEVKKTLYGVGLADSFMHLRKINDTSRDYDERVTPLIIDAWKSITRKPYPQKDEPLPDMLNMIKHVLIMQAHQPVRIVLGYDGYTSESTLRNGFYKFMAKKAAGQKKPIEGFGMASFPSQIICGKSSLIRLDGMPYNAPISPTDYWPCLASSYGNPLGILLELLWTRFSYLYSLPSDIFGEDLESEIFNKFIDAKWHEKFKGWEFRVTDISPKDLAGAPASHAWEPEYLTIWEFVIMDRLCNGSEERIDDPKLINYLLKYNKTPNDLVKSLSDKKLAGLSGSKIELLTRNSVCAIISGGLYVAAENNTGRFSRWLSKRGVSDERAKSE